ncbi:MAG: hypothetical protein AAFP02_03960 [Bacteroidota bacterium]
MDGLFLCLMLRRTLPAFREVGNEEKDHGEGAQHFAPQRKKAFREAENLP